MISKNLKILIVTPHYPPKRLGGTELRARKLARWLHDQGAYVEVICVEEVLAGDHDQCEVKCEQFENVLVHRLYLTHSGETLPFRYSYKHPEIEAYITKTIQDSRPDLIHLISGYLITAAAIDVGTAHNIPTVMTVTDYWFVCPRINLIRSNGQPCGGPYSALDCTRCLLSESRRYRLPEQLLPGIAERVWNLIGDSENLLQRIPLYQEVLHRQQHLVSTLNRASVVTIPTNSLRSRLVHAGVKDQFHLSRHGVIPEALGIDPENLSSQSSLLRFGFMGQVLFSKGVDILVHAFKQLVEIYPNIALSVWGGLDSQPQYVKGLQEILAGAPNVNFEGRYEPAQVGAILRDIDVLVVPSRWPEIGPFVILEAFATKTPVIATRMGNMMELVEHEVNGLLFEPDSVEDLKYQMERFLQEPELQECLRAQILPVRTHEEEMNDIAQLYTKVLESHRG